MKLSPLICNKICNLSEAIHHFKETEVGLNYMCEIVEKYANDKALDEVLIMGIRYCPSKEILVDDAMEQFPNIDKNIIISKVSTFGIRNMEIQIKYYFHSYKKPASKIYNFRSWLIL